MPRGANQKAKLLYLHQILSQQTDPEHPMTIARMMELLTAQGVEVRDRKSLYDDLETLRVFGLDISSRREGRTVGYYVDQRTFELPELKLLVDAVQSSRFITRKKTGQLIRKVESLASVHQGRQLQRQVFVTRRIKSMNESIYYTVDALHDAIDRGSPIRFRYFEWAMGRSGAEKRLRREGAFYEASPWWLIWDNENYYLVAFDHQSREVRHFRVDKMQELSLLPGRREGAELLASFDPGAYAGSLFGMYHGPLETVKLRFEAGLLGVVIDRFGREVFLRPDGEDHFAVTVQAAVSPQFLSWIISFGARAEVLSPPAVREQLCQLLQETEANYHELASHSL